MFAGWSGQFADSRFASESIARMRSATLAIAVLAVPAAHGFAVGAATRAPRGVRHSSSVSMGLFDELKKAFDNVDYSQSPATYEQTNARASHVLVKTEAECASIKEQIAAGDLAFEEAAMKYSTCNSASRGGKLGKFVPGTMVPEFDEVVFSVKDTGMLNPKNGAMLYEPKYATGEVHGPVKTDFGYHLIKVETRTIAEFDFRAKEGKLPKKGDDGRGIL